MRHWTTLNVKIPGTLSNAMDSFGVRARPRSDVRLQTSETLSIATIKAIRNSNQKIRPRESKLEKRSEGVRLGISCPARLLRNRLSRHCQVIV
jgi:hypothetical protein